MSELLPQLPDQFSPVAHRHHGRWVAANFIAGQWTDSESRTAVQSPLDGREWLEIPRATPAQIDEALAAALTAQPLIRDIPAVERIVLFERAADLLRRHEELFRALLLIEAGKPAREAAGELAATGERLRMTMQEVKKITGEYIPGDWARDTTGKIAIVIHEPVGSVAAISSFNYPLYIPAAKIIPALLAGNSVVAKPSSSVALTLLCFARLLEEAGFPPGALNVVTGSGEVGDRLVADERIDMISFTGSTDVGRRIAQTAGIKKLHLELGGKGAAIVLEDADLELAAAKCVEGSLKNAGQRCDAISVVLVMDAVAEPFVRRVRDALAARWRTGDPRLPETQIGPVINRHAAERVQQLIDDALSRGARLLAGGRHRDCYVEATLLDHVPPDARIALEETFGPVVTILRVKDDEEALRLAQRGRFGLDSCVFTANFYRMWKLAKRLQVGGVAINDLPRHGSGYFPFGGVRDSGIGYEGIGYSIEEMTRRKTIAFNLEPAGLGKPHRIDGS